MVKAIDKLNFVELVLTCGSWQEAQKIADTLLGKKLVGCVEFMDVESKYRWQGNVVGSKEVKLIMQSVAHLFDKIEAEIKELHSYDTFVLQQIPLTNLSKAARIWLEESTDDRTN